MRHRAFLSSALVVATTAIGVYCLRTSDARAIEGFPDEMRALAELRTVNPSLGRGVRDLHRFWSLPPDAQRAAMTECYAMEGTPKAAVASGARDCMFADADHVADVLARRTVRRGLGYAAFVIAFLLLASSIQSARPRKA